MSGKNQRLRETQGFTLIELMIVIGIIIIIASVSIPNLMRSRLQSNEAATIQNLRAVVSAQAAYHAANREYATDLDSLANANPPFIDQDVLEQPHHGYLFVFGGDEINYTLNANPSTPGLTGIRYFYTDAGGVVRFDMNAPATEDSPPI